LFGDLGEALAEDDDAVAFGAFETVAPIVLPVFAGGDGEADDALAVAGATGFGVAAEIADQLDAIEITGHLGFLLGSGG
jgi:hypothetical protein